MKSILARQKGQERMTREQSVMSARNDYDELFPDDKTLIAFRKRLLDWFKKHGRIFPWRQIQDPYAVWVSEIMLQQTTTATVEGYYQRFMALYPDIMTLAAASESEILRFWEGLGYYRRAVMMCRAASVMKAKYNGHFPDDFDSVLALPGIGRYTAGAILSFAFDRRFPILEANTIRLHARLLGLEYEPASTLGNRILWSFAEKLLPQTRSGRFNLALMDLGNLVCTPDHPDCFHCPAQPCCQAAQTGTQHLLPVKKTQIQKENRTEVAFLVTNLDQDRFLFLKYPSGGRWSQMWDFPRFLQTNELPVPDDSELIEKLRLFVRSKTIRPGRLLFEMNHCVTRYKIRLLFYGTEDCLSTEREGRTGSISLAAGNYDMTDIETKWLSLSELESIALNSTARKLVRFVPDR